MLDESELLGCCVGDEHSMLARRLPYDALPGAVGCGIIAGGL
jgi:hypothetical protein